MVERLKRREPGIAPAVVKEDLAAMTEKAGQIAPVRGVGQALHPVHIDRFLDLVDIDALAVLRPERAACGRSQDAGNTDALGSDAAVPRERRVELGAVRQAAAEVYSWRALSFAARCRCR